MASGNAQGRITLGQLFGFFVKILGPEKEFYFLAVIYGIGISLLSLATPISVQMLINTVANTGLTTPLVVLSITLFVLLLISGLLNALRVHLMEIFGRRFYARMVSEIALRSIYAENPFFLDDSKGALFNRYFDIIIVQKTMPYLLVGGFTIILQAVVGFTLVSFYHPLFLVFNIVVIMLMWAIWGIWGRAAVFSGIDLSHKKHNAAAWLEGLGSSNGFFKSERHIAHALGQTDRMTGGYVDQHKRHFRNHFAQTVGFLVLYAASSAMLLGLGGWLVIQGQLSLGQLVAAELVLSAVYFGVSQLGYYFVYFYDLCAAVEELSLFYDVQQEEPSGSHQPKRGDAGLKFVNVKGDGRSGDVVIDIEIPSGVTAMASSTDHGVQRLVSDLLKRHENPQSGYITFGGVDVREMEVHALRQDIIVLNRPTIIESTIREYLYLSAGDASPESVLRALTSVGLEPIVASLPDGLDTKVAATGWPLSITETMQLKLAAAMLARPRVLIINQLFDLMADVCLRGAITEMRNDPATTMIYFSNRTENLGFEQFLYFGRDKQEAFKDFDEFRRTTREAQDRSLSVLDGSTPILPHLREA